MNNKIDYTLLKANATKEDIVDLCKVAKEKGYYSVCVNPCHVRTAKKELLNSNVKVCTVIGFPLGASTTVAKISEVCEAKKAGADEFDMVINIADLKAKDYFSICAEVNLICHAAGTGIVKVIIETCYLTAEEIFTVCTLLNKKTTAEFVKTSTGFGNCGATVFDISLMRSAVKDAMKIKASGGIHTKEQAEEMIAAGADRIGTSRAL